MKKIKMPVLSLLGLVLWLSACKKKECHECHYEDPVGAIVEIGEKCNEELEALEANGYSVSGSTYTVHCHEH